MFNKIRNNVIITVGGKEDAELACTIGRAVFQKYELDGYCKNCKTISNKHGDIIISMRSNCPLYVCLDIMSFFHSLNIENLDIAYRPKFTEEWITFIGNSEIRPKLHSAENFTITMNRNRKVPLFFGYLLSI